MNDVDARAVAVFGGFQGEFRKVHRAAYEPVQLDGVARIYDTAAEAETAAWRALKAHLCGEIVRSGDKASAARSQAEELFGKVFPGKGRKPVEVVRR
ncbi:MAG: hypothetical protein J0H34_20850 [Rhizobiales bacterium]|nr:hypothetical protein [Hyphomicrobiales bacterium]